MNIILGEDQAQALAEKYTVLSLDTFSVGNNPEPIRSFCVIETLPLGEIPQIDSFRDLHESLMVNYARRNWSFCDQAIEHLMGRWNHELDSFYADLSSRVQQYRLQEPPEDWSPIINR